MYESFFRFAKPPFRLVADPSMLFVSRSVREALGRLEYLVRTGKGIAVMTGEVGTGKTTLVNRFLDKAGAGLRTAYIFNPSLSGLQLLKTLAEELGVPGEPASKVELTRAIYEVLLRHGRAGLTTVVFVDEAQILPFEALEELRLVSNLETWRDKLLHIVLVGQPELLDKLESFHMRQLRQRVELFIEIEPMSPSETRQYIEHRLHMANPQRQVHFTDGACQLIHRLSRGVPRDINKICDAALLVAYVEETGTVTSKHVREAVRTIDAQRVSLPLRAQGGARPRLWAPAAAVAAVLALLPTHDSAPPDAVRSGQVAALGAGSLAEPGPRVAPGTFGETSLVHLASFRERAGAEGFARGVTPAPGEVLYLQQVDSSGRAWHRVLLGNFTDFHAARAYAERVQSAGTYAYAQAVRVPRAGLQPLETP